uniref:Uncharacterized protein n=1 Tax=uncultured prokaryote TaxID=198431 RepID=A0A0H5QNZ7_9ZZZZ|nr:hypothetical protein [uncultured prokaryote]
MKVRYEFAGIARSEKHLCVFFEIVTGSVRVVKSVMIPWGELVDQNTLSYFDKAVRRELEARWDAEKGCYDDEIPGID